MPEVSESKYLVTMTWDDAPHLDEPTKAALWESIPPYQREARAKGVPSLGSGAIYPVAESDIIVEPFDVPEHWPKAFGMDVGWKCTAGVWGAYDADSDVWFLYSEYYRGQAEPIIHAEGFRARGEWIPGAIDPASRGRGQKDGDQLWYNYQQLGMNLHKADNSIEAGIMQMWQLLSTGKMKVFSSLTKWREEYRLYRRDEKGQIVKEFDHLMDCTRYFVKTGRNIACRQPHEYFDEEDRYDDTRDYQTGY